MNKELKTLIEKQGTLNDSERRANQIEIGKKVREIINQYTDLDKICEETGCSMQLASRWVYDWIVDCTR